jgi:hypothetical protein
MPRRLSKSCGLNELFAYIVEQDIFNAAPGLSQPERSSEPEKKTGCCIAQTAGWAKRWQSQGTKSLVEKKEVRLPEKLLKLGLIR